MSQRMVFKCLLWTLLCKILFFRSNKNIREKFYCFVPVKCNRNFTWAPAKRCS